jgi:hypothetical protein
VNPKGLSAGRHIFLEPTYLMLVFGKMDYSATTDALGHFLFEDVKTGTCRFGYASPAYLSSGPCLPAVRLRSAVMESR